MSDKFQNRYRIPSTRLQNWDYNWNASYFVTICTKNRKHFFGEIINGQMKLNEIGLLSDKYWNEIPIHFPFVELGAFVTMPNHIHGILIINKPNDGRNDAQNNVRNIVDNIGLGNVETQNIASLHYPSPIQSKNKFGPQSQNLASIVRGYKIGVTMNSRSINPNFVWQPRYHDHIIRNFAEFDRIQNYIFDNPQKWREDKFYE